MWLEGNIDNELVTELWISKGASAVGVANQRLGGSSTELL